MDVELDDLFNAAEQEDADLFASSSGASPSKSERASTSPSETGPQDVTQHNASAPGPRTVDIQSRFNTLYNFVHKSVVDRTALGIPHQTRSSAWLKLNLLASSPEDLERIMEMMPKWRSTGQPFPIGLAETFASESTVSLF